jgi:hypothetical protein
MISMVTAVTLAAMLVVGQAAPAKESLADQVARLVKQLDSGLAQREAAKKQLIALGPAALEHLPTEGGTPTQRKELGEVRGALEAAHARSTGEASYVTIEREFRNFAELLAEIEKQTGNRVIDLRRADQKSDDFPRRVSCEKAEFWKVIDLASGLLGLTTDPYAQLPDSPNADVSRAIALIKVPSGQSRPSERAAYSGPFRLEVTDVYARRNVREPAASTLKLTVQLEWEPKNAPIAVSQSLEKIQTELDVGQLELINPKAQIDVTISRGGRAATIEVPFALPPRGAKTIKSLAGEMSVLMPGRAERFRFGNLTSKETVKQRRGNVTVYLFPATRAGVELQIRVEVLYDKTAGGVQSHYGWIYDDRGLLVGPDEKPIRATRYDSDGIEGGIQAAYFFKAPADLTGYAFVYQTPTALFHLPVKYEFKDLPLP